MNQTTDSCPFTLAAGRGRFEPIVCEVCGVPKPDHGTRTQQKPWRVVSVKRSHSNDGVFVAEIHEGKAWVARVKSPNESASREDVEKLATSVCVAVNRSREAVS